MAFSTWLKSQMEAANLSPEALARLLGMSDVTVAELRSGALKPSRNQIIAAADLFGVEHAAAFKAAGVGMPGEKREPDVHVVTSETIRLGAAETTKNGAA